MEPSQQAYRNFQRHADRLCLLIVASDYSDREIDIERLHLRVQAETLFADPFPCERCRFLAGEGILWLKRGRDFQILDHNGNVAVDPWFGGRSFSELDCLAALRLEGQKAFQTRS
jgi:hypothetical protein